MFSLPCIIFAGGKSSRMGEDKSLLPFGGFSSLSEFQYERLMPLFQSVHISTKSADKFDFNANFILDPAEVDYAPTAGFVSALRMLDEDRIMVLSVDTPFIDERVFQTLIDADSGELDAVIAKTQTGSHPLCGIYHRSLLKEFERMLAEGDHRLGKLLSNAKTLYVEFSDEEPFANLNHPHEYKDAYERFDSKNR
ncbi:MAG: molybdenum cofactor guanylyltransferase MobA [Sulfuricurvum sp.]|uniref:molybdenum cofactor guanylyltransferase MobA n=1 Tax=Sulfuricurvum sp. TaxID=2025608 RepID=UPI00260AB0F2|nr:molybdenum cofactor guanylyltransferase MobA [Sulfuricurvum sp.]MDD5159910.1 molybdenum cofactor guanylyltransferase MobA [Sulfuricurvum sp.]